MWTERGFINERVSLVALQPNRNPNKQPLPEHPLQGYEEQNKLIWKREDESIEGRNQMTRYRTHRWLQPSGPEAARPQWGVGAKGQFPWQPQVLQLHCGGNKEGTTVNNWRFVLSNACSAHWFDSWWFMMLRQSNWWPNTEPEENSARKTRMYSLQTGCVSIKYALVKHTLVFLHTYTRKQACLRIHRSTCYGIHTLRYDHEHSTV